MKIIITIIISLIMSAQAFASYCILPDGINIQTKKRMLYICERSRVVKQFNIAIGTKGAGKKYEGDNKTPLGLYDLASPRTSKRFGIFIPIEYPTPQQLAAGYTGKDVGIHGPMQYYRWADSWNTKFNWTQGCIAVGNNEQITFIANWVDEHPFAKVYIS